MIAPHAPLHHIVNAAALGAPVISWVADAQPILTVILTLMGIGWYILLYVKEWQRRK